MSTKLAKVEIIELGVGLLAAPTEASGNNIREISTVQSEYYGVWT